MLIAATDMLPKAHLTVLLQNYMKPCNKPRRPKSVQHGRKCETRAELKHSCTQCPRALCVHAAPKRKFQGCSAYDGTNVDLNQLEVCDAARGNISWKRNSSEKIKNGLLCYNKYVVRNDNNCMPQHKGNLVMEATRLPV